MDQQSLSRENKEDAEYHGSSMRKQHCGECVHFSGNATCEIVEGWVGPGGWCKYFTQGGADHDG